jgi:hypothetical protein
VRIQHGRLSTVINILVNGQSHLSKPPDTSFRFDYRLSDTSALKGLTNFPSLVSECGPQSHLRIASMLDGCSDISDLTAHTVERAKAQCQV